MSNLPKGEVLEIRQIDVDKGKSRFSVIYTISHTIYGQEIATYTIRMEFSKKSNEIKFDDSKFGGDSIGLNVAGEFVNSASLLRDKAIDIINSMESIKL